MSAALLIMVMAGFVFSVTTGSVSETAQAAMQAGSDALSTVLALLGGFMFFSGLIRILEKAGIVRLLVRMLERPLRWLFGDAVSLEAMQAIAMNLSANMLGIGNAATPMGLKAARLLNAQGQEKANAALCLLLVINATSVQLFPASVVALRAAAGSVAPEAIVWPMLVSSTASTAVGITLCKLCERGKSKA